MSRNSSVFTTAKTNIFSDYPIYMSRNSSVFTTLRYTFKGRKRIYMSRNSSVFTTAVIARRLVLFDLHE